MEAQDKKISVSRRVMNAILKLQKSKGVSLVDLKKYLRNEKNLDVDKYNEEIKLALKRFMDCDKLTRENGMYKVKEAKKAREKGARIKESGPGKISKNESPARKRSTSRNKSLVKESGTGKYPNTKVLQENAHSHLESLVPSYYS